LLLAQKLGMGIKNRESSIMRRRSRALCGGWLVALAVVFLAGAEPALGKDLDFLASWSGAGLGNAASAHAILTIDDTELLNPGYNHTSSNPFLVDFTLTVVGASSGNGIFTLDAFDSIVLYTGPGNPGDLPLDFTRDLVGQPTGSDSWGTPSGGAGGDFNVASAVPGTPTGGWFFEICTDAGGGDCVDLIAFEPLGAASPSAGEVLKCQDAIAKAGQKYASDRHKALSKCRDGLSQGKALFQDKAKTTPLEGSHQCTSEYRTAAKLDKAGLKARKQIEKCTDALVALLGACASTVDGLVNADATSGCLLTSHKAAVDDLLEAEYGY
jgi:hypothetical protein